MKIKLQIFSMLEQKLFKNFKVNLIYYNFIFPSTSLKKFYTLTERSDGLILVYIMQQTREINLAAG